MSLQNSVSPSMGKRGLSEQRPEAELGEPGLSGGKSTTGGEDSRCKVPGGLSLEDEVRCSLPQPHLWPVQKPSCHLTRLVTVIIDGLGGRDREDFVMMTGLVPAH